MLDAFHKPFHRDYFAPGLRLEVEALAKKSFQVHLLLQRLAKSPSAFSHAHVLSAHGLLPRPVGILSGFPRVSNIYSTEYKSRGPRLAVKILHQNPQSTVHGHISVAYDRLILSLAVAQIVSDNQF